MRFIHYFQWLSVESLIDTSRSTLKKLPLCFIILNINGDHVTTQYVHHTEKFFFNL